MKDALPIAFFLLGLKPSVSALSFNETGGVTRAPSHWRCGLPTAAAPACIPFRRLRANRRRSLLSVATRTSPPKRGWLCKSSNWGNLIKTARPLVPAVLIPTFLCWPLGHSHFVVGWGDFLDVVPWCQPRITPWAHGLFNWGWHLSSKLSSRPPEWTILTQGSQGVRKELQLMLGEASRWAKIARGSDC